MVDIIGTGSLNAGFALISVGSESIRHLSLARGFLRGMQILANGPEDGIPACQFLAGWTLESTLKSFLAHHGKDKSSLQSIQHDLAALWELAATLGLGVLTCPPDWCQSLNSIHYGPDKHHRYHSRYPTNWNGCVVPDLKALAANLKALLSAVEAVVVSP